MKKYDIFTFKTPNGVEVPAIVLHVTLNEKTSGLSSYTEYLCYAQNRLFIASAYTVYDEGKYKELEATQECIVVHYAILPEFDDMLERYNDIQVAQAETVSGM